MSMMEDDHDLTMPAHVHTIPVDAAFVLAADTMAEAALEAFKEMCIFGRRLTFTEGGTDKWANISCRGGCENLATT